MAIRTPISRCAARPIRHHPVNPHRRQHQREEPEARGERDEQAFIREVLVDLRPAASARAPAAARDRRRARLSQCRTIALRLDLRADHDRSGGALCLLRVRHEQLGGRGFVQISVQRVGGHADNLERPGREDVAVAGVRADRNEPTDRILIAEIASAARR